MNQLFRSATLKLTVWYMAILTFICLGFSFAIYQFVTNELRHSLGIQSQRLLDEYPGFNFDSTLRLRQDYQQGAHRIFWQLVYFDAVVLLLAGFFSYALARRTLEPIAEAHEQQKRFTADVSHELRTPLTALKMSSEVTLLDVRAGKADLRDTIKSNLEEATKLELLINNLLRLARLEAEELQQSFQNIALQPLLDMAFEQVATEAEQHGVSIIQRAKTNALVRGDHDSLVQLLVILLDNAIKYSSIQGKIYIDVKEEAETIQVRITDEGHGIDPEHLPHVFNRFYRADGSRSGRSGGGYGLGLSIAKLIADIHKTAVTLTSAPGAGTTASFTLEKVDQSAKN